MFVLPAAKMLSSTRNPILQPLPSVAGVEQELKKLPHLTHDRRVKTRPRRRRLVDARKSESARAAVGELPGEGESLHMVISGRFALWHLVPAIHALSGQSIDQLHIATLGFSRDNIDELCAMVDAGQIGTATLLCSHYFKSTSSEIYTHARDQFAKRPERTTFFSVRTHAKLLLLKLADGRTYAVESSANLRSCRNIEQMTVAADAELYGFHTGWIDQLKSKGVR